MLNLQPSIVHNKTISQNLEHFHSMDQDFFTNLPPELIINILSRLSVKSVVCCKCVSKLWIQLLQSHEFICSHLSKSLPGIIVYLHERDTKFIKVFELLDEIGLEHHNLHYKLLTKFDSHAFISPLHHSTSVEGSVNGLVFLRDINTTPQALYICNPITREFIDLPRLSAHSYPAVVTYGFGISNITGQYKVVRIFHECMRDPNTHTLMSSSSQCEVYTLGTGSWRSVGSDYFHEYSCRSYGAFFNGCLHWLVLNLKGEFSISCFDLETYEFSVLLLPTCVSESRRLLGSLTVLKDQLCLCDNTPENEIVVWIMNGEEKSWEKAFVVIKNEDFAGECYEVVYLLKVFKDGDILMSWQEFELFYYSNRTKVIASLDLFETRRYSYGIQTWLHVPSFVMLRSFVMESVLSF